MQSEPALNHMAQLQFAMLWARLTHSSNHSSALEAYRTCLELSERNLAISLTLDMQQEVVRVEGVEEKSDARTKYSRKNSNFYSNVIAGQTFLQQHRRRALRIRTRTRFLCLSCIFTLASRIPDSPPFSLVPGQRLRTAYQVGRT